MSDALDVSVDYEQPSTWIAEASALRTVREFWAAKLAKRKDQLLSGDLLLAAVVHRRTFATVRLTRDRLQRLPEGSAADLAAELDADAEAIRTLMRDTIDAALYALVEVLQSKR